MKPQLGFTLQPEQRYIELCTPLLQNVEYIEVTPETTWRLAAEGELERNGYGQQFLKLIARSGHACVAHGVAFSLGSAAPSPTRRERWIEQLRRDHEQFRFMWYTDHLGVTELAGRNLTLPLALPDNPAALAAVQRSLRAMQAVLPDVGFENSAFYYYVSDPMGEPEFIRAAFAAPRTHLLLDLHNVYTNALNLGFDPEAYLERLPFEKVIEVHLSGGTESEPNWLPSRCSLRLDSHDHSVPEAVWRLAERYLPRCTGLRGLTLERMESTVSEEHVPLLREELKRARGLLEASHGSR